MSTRAESLQRLLQTPGVYELAAAGQAADAAICVKPIDYVARCLNDVGYPADRRWIFPVIKVASAVGLASARFAPVLARFTAVMLTLYFSLAVGTHLRARDLRLNFAAATSLLAFYSALAVTGPPTPAVASRETR